MRPHPVALAVALSTLAGCVPIPHYSRTQPDIDGVLLVDGAPRAGAEVSACKEYPLTRSPGAAQVPCERRIVTLTDAQGRFHLDGYGHVVMFLWLAPDAYSAYGFSVKDGERNGAWSVGGFGLSPSHLDMVCTLDAALVCRRPGAVPQGAARMAD